MEKLQYLCWAPAELDASARGALARNAIVPKLLALRPRGLSMQVDDADADVPVPMPAPEDDPQPFLVISIWLDRYDDRAPFEAVRCHVFITESTFGLPIYRWRPQAEIAGKEFSRLVGATGVLSDLRATGPEKLLSAEKSLLERSAMSFIPLSTEDW